MKNIFLKPAIWVLAALIFAAAVVVIPREVPENKIPLSDVDVYCLTRNAYYEARGDSQMSQIAVTHVVLNRVYDKQFPKTVCEVVYQKNRNERRQVTVCQFSWYCDSRMMTRVIDKTSWEESYKAVTKAISIYYAKDVDVTQGSTFYHATYVNPNWRNLEKVTSIGSHIFYKVSQND